MKLESKEIQRDYMLKLLRGELKGLTGYDGVYEEPENPELILDTDKMSVEEEVEAVLRKVKELGYLKDF